MTTKKALSLAVDQVAIGAMAAVVVAFLAVADYSLLVNVMVELAGKLASSAAAGVVAAAIMAGIAKDGRLGLLLLTMLLGLEAMLAVLRELAVHAELVKAATEAAAAHAKAAASAAQPTIQAARIGPQAMTVAGDAAVKLLHAQTDITDKAATKAAREIPFSYLGTAAMALGSMLLSLAIKLGTGKAVEAVSGLRVIVGAKRKPATRRAAKKPVAPKAPVVRLAPRGVPAYGGRMAHGMKVR
jgi:hypothetical protein